MADEDVEEHVSNEGQREKLFLTILKLIKKNPNLVQMR